MTNYTKKAFRGAGIVFITGVLTAFFAYLIRIFLARSLSPNDFGLFYAIFTFLIFLLIFRDIGLGTALVRFIPKYNVRKDYSKIKTLVLSSLLFQFISSLIMAGVLILISSLLAKHYFKVEISSPILQLFTLYIFTSLLFLNVRHLLRAFQNIFWFSIAEIIRDISFLVITLMFFTTGWQIFGAVLGFILCNLVAFLILLFPASKYFFIFKHKTKDFWKTTKQLFQFGIPVIFTGIGEKVISYIDVLILTYFVSLTAVGIYNIIMPTAMVFLFLARSVSSVLLPMISELWEKKDMKRISAGFRLIYSYSFVITIPVLFTAFTFSDILIRLFFGNEYVSATLAFKILLVGVLCYIVAQVNHSALSGIGKPKEATKIILVIAVINILLNFILIPHFKLTGAAIATAVSYVIALVISTLRLVKFIKVAPPWLNWLKILFSGAVFISVIYLIKGILILNPWVEMAISLMVAGTVYLALVFAIKIIELKELKLLVKRIL